MKSRRFSLAIMFALVLFFAFAYGLAPLMKTSAAAPAPAENAPFKGKITVVTLSLNYSAPLEHAQVRKLGERSFLVGKVIDDGNPTNWAKGQKTWIPLDRAEMIVEFESVEAMKKAYEEAQKNAPAPPAQAGQAGQAGSP